MTKLLINKHIDNISELKKELFTQDIEKAKGEIIICNDKEKPSLNILNNEGEIVNFIENKIVIPNDIIVAGLEHSLGVYNNNDIIKAGTNIVEIIQNILCKEMFPNNIKTTIANAVAKMKKLTLKLKYNDNIFSTNNSIFEVGSLIKLDTCCTNGTGVEKNSSKIENIEYGYSLENDNTKDYVETYIEKDCIAEIEDNNYTISAVINSGFTADNDVYVKTVPQEKNGIGHAILDKTDLGCVIEGDNKITINAEGANYRYTCEKIDKIYYCSNLGNTNQNKYNEGINAIENITPKPKISESINIIGKYKCFIGYSSNISYNQLDSDSIRNLEINEWLNINTTTNLFNDTYIKSNGKSIVIACPNKYKLTKITNSIGTDIIRNFTSMGEIIVKTGEINTTYNVYLYPITNNVSVEFKNIKIEKI